MSTKSKRRVWKPEEKLRIVLAGLDPGVEISEVCRREGVHPTQYHAWKKQLMGSAAAVFGDKQKSQREAREAQAQRDQLRRKDSVIAEITAENLELKKTLSD